MTQPAVARRIYPLIEPEQREAANERIARHYANRLKKELPQVFGQGIAHFGRGKPMDRYQAWVQGTLDTVMIQNARKTIQDYVIMGQLDYLIAETQLAQLVDTELQRREELARMQAGWDGYREGVRAGLYPYPGSQMWSLLFELPDYVVDWCIAGFQATSKAQAERNERLDGMGSRFRWGAGALYAQG